MKIRQAKKIMKRCYGSPSYMGMILDGLDVVKSSQRLSNTGSLDWLCIMPLKVAVMAELIIVL